jgi:hypothetical protein
MRGSKAKKIRKAVYGEVSIRISREPDSLGEKLRKKYQKAKKGV